MKRFFLIVFFILTFSNVYALEPIRCRNLLKPGVYKLSHNVSITVLQVRNYSIDSYIEYDPNKETQKLKKKVILLGEIKDKFDRIYDFITCSDKDKKSWLQNFTNLHLHVLTNRYQLNGFIKSFDENIPYDAVDGQDSIEDMHRKRTRWAYREEDGYASDKDVVERPSISLKKQILESKYKNTKSFHLNIPDEAVESQDSREEMHRKKIRLSSKGEESYASDKDVVERPSSSLKKLILEKYENNKSFDKNKPGEAMEGQDSREEMHRKTTRLELPEEDGYDADEDE